MDVSPEEKARKIIVQALQRVVEIVLLSRVPAAAGSSSGRGQRVQLLLDIDDVGFVGDTLRAHMSAGADLHAPWEPPLTPEA